MRGFTLAFCLACCAAGSPTVLITGATGRLGSLLYSEAVSKAGIGKVRAFVTNVTKARESLKCDKCDASEGIYAGNVTDRASLAAAMDGVDSVLIAVGSSPKDSPAEQRAIEFGGVENTVAALYGAKNEGTAPSERQVVLCSSMGTTDPNPPPFEGGKVLFWKLNAEAFLMSSGIGATVVKPCGLKDGPAGRSGLNTLHDDKNPAPLSFTIARADVAAVMAEAVAQRSSGLRFGLCNKAFGPPTHDLAALLREAQWPWQK